MSSGEISRNSTDTFHQEFYSSCRNGPARATEIINLKIEGHYIG